MPFFRLALDTHSVLHALWESMRPMLLPEPPAPACTLSLAALPGAQVVAARVDGHELFRAAAGAAGVVVLVKQAVLPDALGAALRAHKALDDAG